MYRGNSIEFEKLVISIMKCMHRIPITLSFDHFKGCLRIFNRYGFNYSLLHYY